MPIDGKNMLTPDFWANMAAEHIYTTAERRVTSAKTLETIILWAFGFFSVGGFALNLFGALKEFNHWALICFGVCFFLLVLAYYYAGKSQFPDSQTFRMGDIQQIATAFSDSAKTQTRVFKTATALTGVAFFFLALGLLILFGTVKKEEEKVVTPQAHQPVVKTGVEKRNDSLFLPITIQWRKNEPVHISILKSDIVKVGTATSTVESRLYGGTFYADTSGHIYYSHLILPKDSVKNVVIRTLVSHKIADTLSERISSIKLTIPAS